MFNFETSSVVGKVKLESRKFDQSSRRQKNVEGIKSWVGGGGEKKKPYISNHNNYILIFLIKDIFYLAFFLFKKDTL